MVVNAYGLTETCALVTLTRPDDTIETIANTAGRVIDGVEIRCVDVHGNAVSAGDPGEIEVRGFTVMAGYLDDEEETAKAIRPDGWLRTGDVGIIDAQGCLRVTDRVKDMFIVGGFNCYPAEIEKMMLGHPGVQEVAVVGVPDERLGEVAKATVVPKHDLHFDTDDFLAWCRANMA
ncbi:AMP-binding protein, partial [Rhizobiaceae sp. 2RAB30]